MKFSIKDFFSKCDQIRWKLPICSHLLKKSLMENLIRQSVPNRSLKEVENLPVIYIFHQSLLTMQLILITDAVFKRWSYLFLSINQKTSCWKLFPSRTFQEKFSAATYFLISYMLLLSSKRTCCYWKIEKMHIPKTVFLSLKFFGKLFLRAIRIQDFRNFSLEES